MLQNAYFLAKIGADTAENEQHFAEILPTDARARGVLGERRERRAPGRAELRREPRERPERRGPHGRRGVRQRRAEPGLTYLGQLGLDKRKGFYFHNTYRPTFCPTNVR